MAARLGLDREQVIDAAVELLEERGVSRRPRARRPRRPAGRPPSSLYAHVDGADGLRRDLRLRGLGGAGRPPERGSHGPGRTGRGFEPILRAWLGFAEECPGLYRRHAPTAGRRCRPDRGDRGNHPAAATVLRSYGLSERQVTHWYRIMFAAVYGFASLRADGMFTMPADPDETLATMIEMFAGPGRRGALRPRTETPDGPAGLSEIRAEVAAEAGQGHRLDAPAVRRLLVGLVVVAVAVQRAMGRPSGHHSLSSIAQMPVAVVGDVSSISGMCPWCTVHHVARWRRART